MGNQYSKERLQGEVKADILTLSIGILDEFEQTWGYLWGGGRPDRKGKWVGGTPDEHLEDSERAFREKWLDFRKYVLDNGNDVIRGLEETMETYDIEWKRYRNQFIVRRGNNE